MKEFLCELLFTCTMLVPGAKPVDELTYGTVLYEYFQEQHQDALLATMVAEAQDRRGEDWLRFELAKGSFAFADRMYGFASGVFQAVPDEELSQLDAMRLAFHLSREYHRRQDWTKLEGQLAKIDLGKTWRGRLRSHPEVEYMRAELAVHNGQFDTAMTHFDLMEATDPLRAYGLFNLGVAYREADMMPQAQLTFTNLASMPAYSDEAYDLAQRAKLALAFIARQQEDQRNAQSVLTDLPGEGRYQDVALAAYGGLAMDNEDYELAARIWMTLQDSQYWTPSTATARLGFPLSLEKMANTADGTAGASTEAALLQYQAAESSFSQRLDQLNQLTYQAQDPAWVNGLLEVFANPDQTEEQQMALMQRWEEQLGHTDWLEWLSSEPVHQVLVQWRELNEMQDYLASLPEHLEALQAVADEQQRMSEQARTMLVDDGLLEQRDNLSQSVAELNAYLDQSQQARPAPTHAWMFGLANAEERALLSDLANMRGLIQHMNDADRTKWGNRIGRLEGVVFYRIVEERAKRIQALRTKHNELRDVLADLDARIVRVKGAEEHFVAGVGTDFLAFNDRAGAIIERVAQARRGREEMLASEIRTRMQQEMRQVQQYLLVTRIAIARATDLLAMGSSQ